MYKLNYFIETDNKLIKQFMNDNSFVSVCGNGNPFPVVTHVPVEISYEEDKTILIGHIMKNTDHHKAFLKDENVLCIFNGPHSYISASCYTKPTVASTWNYMTIHAAGTLRFTDESDTIEIIENLTTKYEGNENAGSFKNLSEEYVNRLVKAIIGFKINVKSIDAVFKLSQNHEIDNRKKIIEYLKGLKKDNASLIAKEMEERIHQPKK